MKDFIGELGIRQEEFRPHYNSQSVIQLAKNAAYHSRTKHIQRRYHWLWERVEDKDFALTKIHTEENVLDMLTKVLSAEKLDVCRRRIRMSRGSLLGFVFSLGSGAISKSTKKQPTVATGRTC